jgi:hypothetical protein
MGRLSAERQAPPVATSAPVSTAKPVGGDHSPGVHLTFPLPSPAFPLHYYRNLIRGVQKELMKANIAHY